MADTTYSWLQIVSAADPNRDTSKIPIYYFGGNNKVFTEDNDPYN